MENIEQELIDSLKETPESRYNRLSLTFNPFPAAAIAQYTHFKPIDDQINDRIKNFIKATYKANPDNNVGDYAGLTIVGEYGFGKTHLMKYIKGLIDGLNANEEAKFSALTAFIDRPSDSPQNIISKILEDLQPDNLRRLIWYCIYPNLVNDRERFFTTYFRRNLFNQIEGNELFKSEILGNSLVFYDKFKKIGGNTDMLFEESLKIITTHNSITIDTSIAQRYLGLIFPEKSSKLNWESLTGYVTSKDVQNKEVLFLTSLVNILKTNGYDMLYVFVDEFEDFNKINKVKLTNYIATLNTMINKERNWAFIISLTQDALQAIKPLAPHLYDRLTSFEIRLRELTLESAKKLIDNYLNYAKSTDTKSHIFSDELINGMLTLTDGNSRGFIKLSHKVIETLADDDSISLPAPNHILTNINF
jgi:hypothetical protein